MLTLAASLVFWIGGLWRLPRAITVPQKRPLCAALLAFAVGAMFDADPLLKVFDRAVAVTNLSDFMAHAFGLTGVYFLLTSLDGLVDGPQPVSTRWLLPFLIVGLLASAALFFSTTMPVETSAFTAEYGRQPTIIGYWSISIVFPVLCLVQLARTIAAYRSSPRVVLRRGLKVAGVGVLFGFGYAGVKLTELVTARDADGGLAIAARTVDHGLLGGGLILIAAGLAAPSIASWTRPLRERRWVRRSMRRLEWLWTRFCVQAGAAAVIRRGTPQFRLLRRVVELRDAQATLWSYLSCDDVDQVRKDLRADADEPSGPEIEAAALALALHRELTSSARGRHADDPPAIRAILGKPGGAINLRAEVDELVVLSSLVRKTVPRVRVTSTRTPAERVRR